MRQNSDDFNQGAKLSLGPLFAPAMMALHEIDRLKSFPTPNPAGSGPDHG